MTETRDDEQLIRELVAKWMSATESGDIATVLSLMTDDVVFLVAGQPPFGKQRFAEAMKPASGALASKIEGRSEIQEIRVSGDMAYMWTRLEVDVTPPGGQPIRRSGHTLSVLHKKDGQWRLARDANLLAPVQA
jgi:uncharacterized protein (TIGR02246 family)